MERTNRRFTMPTTRRSVTHKFAVGGFEGYLTIGLFDDGMPGEIFIKMSKEGSTLSGLIQGFCRAFSIALQYGLPLEDASMDVTCCIRLFQHFHYPEWRQEALTEFARVSRRWVMVTFYDRACVHYWSKRLLAAIKGKPPRVQMISRAQFEADAAAAGLRVVEYRPWLPRIHAQTFTMLEKI